MGYFITANGNKLAYGVKSFIVDTENDLINLPRC